MIAGCRAERILVDAGRAAGVEAVYTDLDPDPASGNGASARVTVRAPVVVVACGSIESPALLLRSAIGGPATGDFLRLHPTVAVTGYLRRAPGLELGAAAGGALAPVRERRRRDRFPVRVRAVDHRAARGSPALALGRRPQAADGRLVARGAADQPHPGTGARPGDDRRGRERGQPLPDQRRGRHPQPPRRGRGADPDPRGGGGERDRRQRAQVRRLAARRGPRCVRRRRHLAADRAARVRALLGAPDGVLPDGRRSRELGRRPARRAARHARGLDRRRERLSDPVRDQPDADDHGAGAADRARDRRRRRCRKGSRSPSPARPATSAERRARARGAARDRADRRHGPAPVRPGRARLAADRVPARRHPRPGLGRPTSSPGADVVIHLAFIIFGDHHEAHRVNLEGSRNVFEATAAAAAQPARLHVVGRGVRVRRGQSTAGSPRTWTPPGPTRFYYSAHKAELEPVLDDAVASRRPRRTCSGPRSSRAPTRPP